MSRPTVAMDGAEMGISLIQFKTHEEREDIKADYTCGFFDPSVILWPPISPSCVCCLSNTRTRTPMCKHNSYPEHLLRPAHQPCLDEEFSHRDSQLLSHRHAGLGCVTQTCLTVIQQHCFLPHRPFK